jgi:gluconate 2-dehydrogenase
MSRPAVLVARAVFPETVARLREHFDVEDNPGDTIFTKPQLIERLKGMGQDVVTSTPEEFAAFIRDEAAKWRRTIESAGIKIQ